MVSLYMIHAYLRLTSNPQRCMRDLKIFGLPPAKEIGQCKIVSAAIGRKLIVARNAMKTAASLVPSPEMFSNTSSRSSSRSRMRATPATSPPAALRPRASRSPLPTIDASHTL